MKRYTLPLLLLACAVSAPVSNAAKKNNHTPARSVTESGLYVFPHQETPGQIEMFSATAYTAGVHQLQTLSGHELFHFGDTIRNIALNPTGINIAVVHEKKNKSNLEVINTNTGLKGFKFNTRELGMPQSSCFLDDGRILAVATEKVIYLLETKKYTISRKIQTPGFTARQMVGSPNGYFLAAVDGNKVIVYNLETLAPRKTFDFDEKVTDVAFSPNNNDFGILTADGILALYNTRTFDMRKMVDNLGDGEAFAFNFDGKYIAAITGPNQIQVVNLVRDSERDVFDMTVGDFKDLTFLYDAHRNTLLAATEGPVVTVRRMPGLEPYYSKLISEEVDKKMDEWLKMMPGETMEQYKARVTEEEMNRRRRLFEDEISTNFAGDLLDGAKMTFGSYDRANNVLALNFDTMPTIYLPVPEDEVTEFADPSKIRMTEVQYGILPDDTFEIVYARVHNDATGKSYIYDNLMRSVMDFMNNDDAISLELLQQQQMEEIKLQEIRQQVVEEAKSRNVLSDHTNITVDTKVVPDYNADGDKILNYQVKFSYQVEPEYSAKEDFAPGKYHVNESGAASAMVDIIRQALEGDLAQYIQEGKKLRINLLGTADAAPIINGIAYDGAYGEVEDEPVYVDGQLSALTVTTKNGIKTNPQLALMRAMGLRDYIIKNIPSLEKMNKDYRYDVEVSEGKGGEFRRITATLTFVDAF